MDFLIRYFERSVKRSGYPDLVVKVESAVSKWDSCNTVSIVEGIAIASEEAVVEVEEVVKVLSKKELKEKAKVEKALAETAKKFKTDAYQVATMYRNKIAKGTNVEANTKELAELEALIVEFKTMTDYEVVAKCQELSK